MTLVAGLTGGIASGKSTVSRMLVARGATLVDADQVARDVVQPGTAGLAAVAATFGPGVLQADGSLNRAALGALVFADPDQLRALEQLLHPRIRATIAQQVDAARRASAPVVVLDAALLVEMGLHAQCDVVCVVHCGADLQRSRLMARNGMTADEAQQRLAAQTDDATRLSHADHAIDNRGTVQELALKVDTLWQRLMQEVG